MTASQMTLEAIRSVPLFASLDDEAAVDLRNLLTDRVVPQNTRLFRHGDKGDAMYVVRNGEVTVERDGRIMETLGGGDIFGEMALIDGAPRSATARAKTDCEVAPINEKTFLFLVHETPFFAIAVMRTLAGRLRHMNET